MDTNHGLNCISSGVVSSAVKLEFAPATVASGRTPFFVLTVLVARSCTPEPVPLSV